MPTFSFCTRREKEVSLSSTAVKGRLAQNNGGGGGAVWKEGGGVSAGA